VLNSKQKHSLSLLNKSFERMKSNYTTKWTDYERMYNSEHTKEFLDLALEQDRNTIFIPLTYSTINIADSVFTTSFFSQGNPLEITAVGDSDDDKKSVLSVLVDYYYEKAKPYMELSKAFLSAGIYGVGAVKIYWDDMRGIPKTVMIPVTEVSFDIDAISSDDNKYIGYQFMQTVLDIKEKLDSGFYSCEEFEREPLVGDVDTQPYRRKRIREIYTQVKDGYEVKTFCDDVCLRETLFKRCPVKYGYLLNRLPSVDTSKRENEVAAVGDSLVRIIKPLNDELNIKRNQRMDLIEKHINPEVYIPESCGVDEDDLLKNGGVKACDTTAGIFYAPITGASEFTNDVMMLKNDIEDASSINGIMRGSTTSSDRRSSSALATINANSSPRLEGMVKLINETLFEPWARDFVRLVYINAPDDLIAKLTERDDNPLGPQGMREELDIDIKVNFGVSINKQGKINDLISIIQMIGQNPNPAPQVLGLLEEIIKLTLGENVDAKKILGISKERGDGADALPNGDEDAKTPLAVSELAGGGGETDSSQNEVNPNNEELDRLRNNEI